MASRVKRVKDPDTDLINHLLDWHSPESSDTAETLTAIRAKFKTLANALLKLVPPGEDRRRAIYDLALAQRSAIFAAVVPQPVEDETPE